MIESFRADIDKLSNSLNLNLLLASNTIIAKAINAIVVRNSGENSIRDSPL